jgi:DNA replication protein DnaC
VGLFGSFSCALVFSIVRALSKHVKIPTLQNRRVGHPQCKTFGKPWATRPKHSENRGPPVIIRALVQESAWVGTHENVFVLGPTGVGKSFVACALAQKACRDGYSALYTRAQSLFRDLAMARADGSLRNLLARLSDIDVLVIDDWAMNQLSEPERRDFWEICEDRYQVRSTILTSQLPVSRWHEQIGDPTLADGILDRLVHNAHRIEMRGDSMRKNRGKPSG